MASMRSIMNIALIVGGAAALWYAYKKGYLEDILGSLGGLGGDGGGAIEPAPGPAEDPCIAECAAKAKFAFLDYDDLELYGLATKKKSSASKKIEEARAKASAAKNKIRDLAKDKTETPAAAKCDCSKYKTEAPKKDEKKSKLALAYAGSYYDGEVLDTAYFVTTPSSFIPRRHENTIAMGVAIA